jgi:hypothetical protein
MCTGNVTRPLTHGLNRKDNVLVFSETLDENAMQILLDLSIADTFPRQCNEWHATKKVISDSCSQKCSTRQHTAFEEFTSEEHEMRRVLHDAVVGDVLELFPCVLFVSTPIHKILRPQALISRSLERDSLSSYHRSTDEDASGVAGKNLKFLSPF